MYFIKYLHSNDISVVLLFQEYDFHVRWPTVKLLTILLTNQCKEVQETILVHPMGVSKLMDLLSDSREIIRNDVSLVLIFCIFTFCRLFAIKNEQKFPIAWWS